MGALVVAGTFAAALLSSGSAEARPRLLGVAAGGAMSLDPTDDFGGSLALSAAMQMANDGPASLLWLRGRLQGVVSDNSWAVMPQLLGDVGVHAGPFEIFISGGVQLFGVASRAKESVFALLGLTGGAGFTVAPTGSWRIGLRGDITWLPTQLAAPLDDPRGEAKQSFLFVTAALTVEFWSAI